MELYEISSNIKALWEMYETDEIDLQTYTDTIESLGAEMIVEEHIKMIRNAEANSTKLTEEADKLRSKAESEKKKAEKAKNLVINFLDTIQEKKINAGIFKVTKCISKSADITDISALPEIYFVPQPPKADKKAILSDLKSGKEINGAKLKESAYIRIT